MQTMEADRQDGDIIYHVLRQSEISPNDDIYNSFELPSDLSLFIRMRLFRGVSFH